MNVILYDNHPLILNALSDLFHQRKYDVIAATTNADNFIFSTIFHQPDLIVIDPISLSHRHLEKLSLIQDLNSKLKTFIYAGNDSAFFLLNSLHINSHAYMSKSCQVNNLQTVLDLLENGDGIILRNPKASHQKAEEDISLMRSLTGREMQMLRFLAAGKNNTVIARELKLSCKTISTYKRSIMQKMQTDKISDVVDLVVRNGFL